ncbi:hypothetical protein PPACK8108_LOCUS17731 [Phakopsora pachyrhizi]|uniref:Uncharacterized protein n=1 Tax=Phakopsora pachyrhizi TaxID=170000 RepID=A0AAV0BC47_PHAPC|nr:hypothetical protein PPACK8108_LOCUS17731 [Phakopsora pachyrhizi]
MAVVNGGVDSSPVVVPVFAINEFISWSSRFEGLKEDESSTVRACSNITKELWNSYSFQEELDQQWVDLYQMRVLGIVEGREPEIKKLKIAYLDQHFSRDLLEVDGKQKDKADAKRKQSDWEDDNEIGKMLSLELPQEFVDLVPLKIEESPSKVILRLSTMPYGHSFRRRYGDSTRI